MLKFIKKSQKKGKNLNFDESKNERRINIMLKSVKEAMKGKHQKRNYFISFGNNNYNFAYISTELVYHLQLATMACLRQQNLQDLKQN